MNVIQRVWVRFRGLPMWGQIAVGVVVVSVIFGPFIGRRFALVRRRVDDESGAVAGLVYPMNAQARAASTLGVDVGENAPVRSDFSDSDAEADRSRECAVA